MPMLESTIKSPTMLLTLVLEQESFRISECSQENEKVHWKMTQVQSLLKESGGRGTWARGLPTMAKLILGNYTVGENGRIVQWMRNGHIVVKGHCQYDN